MKLSLENILLESNAVLTENEFTYFKYLRAYRNLKESYTVLQRADYYLKELQYEKRIPSQIEPLKALTEEVKKSAIEFQNNLTPQQIKKVKKAEAQKTPRIVPSSIVVGEDSPEAQALAAKKAENIGKAKCATCGERIRKDETNSASSACLNCKHNYCWQCAPKHKKETGHNLKSLKKNYVGLTTPYKFKPAQKVWKNE